MINNMSEQTVLARARQSHGASNPAIYQMVARALAAEAVSGGTLVDVGCGTGALWSFVQSYLTGYIGVDAVLYEAFPKRAQFITHNLDASRIPLESAIADVVCAVETIEHVENPRALMRELARVVKPGGLVIVTTPNQLSFLSKLTLILKNQFNAFQSAPGLYPAHITALLEIDLIRIATECGLTQIQIDYTHQGRIPLTAWCYPGLRGRAFSDNLGLICRKPLDRRS